MDPTRHKRGDGLSRLPVSLARPAAPEVSDRTATLLAGDQPGSQGRIKVWSPSRARLWRNLGSHSLLLAMGIVALITGCIAQSWVMVFLMACCLPVVTWMLASTVQSLRHPCYITADDAGIGVTTRSGSCALLWQEMQGVERVSGTLVIRVRSLDAGSPPQRVPVDLSGYPEQVETELLTICSQRARLRQQPTDASLFLRPGVEREAISDERTHPMLREST
ncbi:MAG: hypothetical protein LC772_01810 [Chloroflexi bacterium]|nr:hypothetical protein [Chloroflexota bacterium]